MLAQLERAPEGGDRKSVSRPGTLISDYAATLDDVGIARSTAHRQKKAAPSRWGGADMGQIERLRNYTIFAQHMWG